jgi:hypothetical protein
VIIIIIPIYHAVIITFKDQGGYFTQDPLACEPADAYGVTGCDGSSDWT